MMKNPVLMIGILMVLIFIFQLDKNGFFESRKAKLTPSSCKSVLVKLKRRIPENWKASCEGQTYNNLSVEIESNIGKDKDLNKIRAILYRDLANKLSHIAKQSPQDNLERTFIVRIRLNHPQLVINALTEGKYIVKLATLTNAQLMAEHIKTTVRVQEKLR